MKLIALGETTAYIVTGEEAKLLAGDWRALCRKTFEYNCKVFDKIYREALGLPAEISSEEETRLVHEKYGKMPIDNPEYMQAMGVKNKKLKQESLVITNDTFLEFAKSYNCKLEQVNVFEI